ncbi:hypothetical protein N8500_04660 [Candidatus Puniceispirillum sp.]|nr:hypothetical protein [Candidatus Puniceispirillum sp.]
MSKILIVIGGNSTLSQALLENTETRQMYYQYILFSTQPLRKNRKFILATDLVQLYNGTQDLITKIKIILTNNHEAKATIVFAATPSDKNLYSSSKIMKNAIESVISQTLMKSEEHVKYYIIGSSLAVVPMLNNSHYKRIKRLELDLFSLQSATNHSTKYVMVPPIKPALGMLANLFSTSLDEMAVQLNQSFAQNGSDQKYLIIGNKFTKFVTHIFLFHYLLTRGKT